VNAAGTTGAASRLLDAFARARMVDLTHVIEPGMPVFPTHPQYFAMPWDTHDPAAMNQLLIGEHAGTHLDSPSHFYSDPSDPRCVAVAEIPVQSVIGPAVKVSVTGVDGDAQLGADVLRTWEAAHRELRAGEAVVLHFGWSDRWGTFDDAEAYLREWPGLSTEAARFLVERGVRTVATDCLGIDASSTTDLGAHFALLEHGVTIVENLCSLHLVPDEFLLVTLPLKIAGGTGSPVRAVAVFDEEDAIDG
jgi:kynurenine formamidase